MEKDKNHIGIQYPTISTSTRETPDMGDYDDAYITQKPGLDKEDPKKTRQGKTDEKNGVERAQPEPRLSEAVYTPQGETPNDTLKKKNRQRTFNKKVKNK